MNSKTLRRMAFPPDELVDGATQVRHSLGELGAAMEHLFVFCVLGCWWGGGWDSGLYRASGFRV